jgi:hypothetical protein
VGQDTAMRLMIIAFVIALLVIVDFARFGGHYTRTITDTILLGEGVALTSVGAWRNNAQRRHA